MMLDSISVHSLSIYHPFVSLGSTRVGSLLPNQIYQKKGTHEILLFSFLFIRATGKHWKIVLYYP